MSAKVHRFRATQFMGRRPGELVGDDERWVASAELLPPRLLPERAAV